MSSKIILFPLLLLSVAFPTGTAGQKIICFIFDDLVGKTGFNFFWDHLPTYKCSRFIYVLASVNGNYRTTYLYKISLKSKHVPIDLGVPVNNANTGNIINYAVSWAKRYFRNRIHLVWEDNFPLAKKTKVVKDILKKWKHMKISQAVTCVPGVSGPVATDLLLNSGGIDLYIVHAKVHQSDLNQFVHYPSVCVEPLLKLGVPKEKVSIGLSMVMSMNIKYIEVCNDQTAAQLLLDVGSSLQCLARDRSLHGVMFWGVSTDDFTAITCGKGTYPLVTHYHEAGSNCDLR